MLFRSLPSLPAVPPVITETVNNASEWQMIGDTLWAFKSWALSQPLQAGCLILFVLAVAFWPRLFPAKSPEPQPSP